MLKFKTTLFTQWKIHQFRECHSGRESPGYLMEVKCSDKIQVILTLCQSLRDETKKNWTIFTMNLWKQSGKNVLER